MAVAAQASNRVSRISKRLTKENRLPEALAQELGGLTLDSV
jgi:hypothetical protein